MKGEVREKKADTPVHTPTGGDAINLSEESEELDQKTFSVVSLWHVFLSLPILRLKPYSQLVENWKVSGSGEEITLLMGS